MRDVHLLFFAGKSERTTSHFLRHRDAFPFLEQKDRVDRIWIIDLIRRDAGRIGSAARLCGKHLVEKAALLDVAGEDFSFVDVLIANRGREILPAGICRISRRITRIRRNVAGAASYSNAIRTDQLVVIVVRRIVHETIAVPFLACLVVELRIWKKPKTKNAGRFAVNAFVDACRFRFYLLIQPQPKFIRLASSTEPGLVYQTQNFETLAARKFAVIEHFQEIHQAVAVLRGVITKCLVATAPEVPSI